MTEAKLSRPRRWWSDLILGVRLAVSGGRAGWGRVLLIASGVGLGVGLLLGAASIPNITHERDQRGDARGYELGTDTVQSYYDGVDACIRQQAGIGEADMITGQAREQYMRDCQTKTVPDNAVLSSDDGCIEFRGDLICGVRFGAAGPNAPVPPGLDELPAQGEMIVSPRLAEVLESDDGDLLRPRLGYKLAGIIGDEGLVGPNDYLFYVGGEDHDEIMGEPISAFGNAPEYEEETPPLLILLSLVGFIVILLPVAMFIAVAARFGGERREQKLAALRLVGADAHMTRRVAAGESLFGALLGLGIGVVLFLIGRQYIESITVWDVSVFTADVRPDPVLTALIAVAVPALAAAVTIMAMRGLIIEPLGVSRRATPRRRRLWWRPVPPIAGMAMLYPSVTDGYLGEEMSEQILVTGGVVCFLVGGAVLLPWLVEATVNRIRGGRVSWQLATRRLQLSGGGTARVVNGIAVAAAGGIALQMLFLAAEDDFVVATGADPNVATIPAADDVGRDELIRDVAAIDGVEVLSHVAAVAVDADGLSDDEYLAMYVMDCDAVTTIFGTPSCADGDVYSLIEPPLVDSGTELTLYDPGFDDNEVKWTLPEIRSDPLTVRPEFIEALFLVGEELVVTPAALGDTNIHESWTNATVVARLDPDEPDAVEHLRNLDSAAYIALPREWIENDKFASVRTGLTIGVTAIMLLTGISMLISTLEQLVERRRLLSVLVAFGTRRRTLATSVLWQTTIPVLLGMVLAAATGVGLGALLLKMVDQPFEMDWANVGQILAIGSGLVLVVTAASMPVLWRLMRPGGLRTE